jgi:hypothetical protein
MCWVSLNCALRPKKQKFKPANTWSKWRLRHKSHFPKQSKAAWSITLRAVLYSVSMKRHFEPNWFIALRRRQP